MKKLRIAILGAGGISPTHCVGIKSHAAAELVAVADSNRPRAEALASQFNIPQIFDSIEAALSDPSIDAVSIALPTFLHAPTAVSALKAGKHVHSDKPFAMNQREAEGVMRAAESSGKIMMVGMNQRFTPEAQTIKACVERGELGEIYFVKAYWTRRSGIPSFGTWFGDKKRSGGGALLDIGVHELDLCLSLLGNFKPISVSGFSYTKLGNRGLGEGGWGRSEKGKHVFDVDDLSGGLLRLEGGVAIQLEAAWARHQEARDEHNVELFGTEGGATVYPARLFQFADDGGYTMSEPRNASPRYPHFNRFHNWIDAILGEAEPECRLEQSFAVQRIIDAIYESAASGREVRLD
ncbi:MAG TPA: Gfo/Idh/MocA family oxidoreductase [Spirochaetia bacterium]|nr:Gfo/Idh/MocA family oxidoreductase [Spirochaetia bacterium]